MLNVCIIVITGKGEGFVESDCRVKKINGVTSEADPGER
jgi:hypothetical protein